MLHIRPPLPQQLQKVSSETQISESENFQLGHLSIHNDFELIVCHFN